MSNRFPRILLAIDGSERAEPVLVAGLDLARSTAATVVVLRCVGLPTELGPEVLGRSPDEVVQSLLDSATEGARAMIERHAGGLPVTLRVEVGVPAPTILRVADEVDASLIVLGAHGYRWSERVLGTTASRVVDRASRSVLVVR